MLQTFTIILTLASNSPDTALKTVTSLNKQVYEELLKANINLVRMEKSITVLTTRIDSLKMRIDQIEKPLKGEKF